MPSYEQQLETYLKNHGIDASIKYNDYYNRYDITFTTIMIRHHFYNNHRRNMHLNQL